MPPDDDAVRVDDKSGRNGQPLRVVGMGIFEAGPQHGIVHRPLQFAGLKGHIEGIGDFVALIVEQGKFSARFFGSPFQELRFFRRNGHHGSATLVNLRKFFLQRLEVHVADGAPLATVKNQHDRAFLQRIGKGVRFIMQVCGNEKWGFFTRVKSLGFFAVLVVLTILSFAFSQKHQHIGGWPSDDAMNLWSNQKPMGGNCEIGN